MPGRVTCANCGSGITIPAGFAKAKARCPGCGYYADVPPDLRSAAEEVESPAPPARAAEPPVAKPARAKPVPKPAARLMPQADPRDPRARFEADPGGVPLLAGTQEEDDDQPYAVPGANLQKCQECRGELPMDATFCVHCGHDLTGKRKPVRTYEPIDKEWPEGLSLLQRLQLLAGAMVLNVVLTALSVATQEDGVTAESVVTHFLFLVFNAGMQTFLIGSFDTLRVTRSGKGKTNVTRQRRVAFVPLKLEKLPWRKSHAVGVYGGQNPGVVSWITCIYLILLGCLPGLLFYWFVIRPERFEAALADEYGSTNDVIYRTQDREHAQAVAAVVENACGLMKKKVM